jgi:hypothetical protein
VKYTIIKQKGIIMTTTFSFGELTESDKPLTTKEELNLYKEYSPYRALIHYLVDKVYVAPGEYTIMESWNGGDSGYYRLEGVERAQPYFNSYPREPGRTYSFNTITYTSKEDLTNRLFKFSRGTKDDDSIYSTLFNFDRVSHLGSYHKYNFNLKDLSDILILDFDVIYATISNDYTGGDNTVLIDVIINLHHSSDPNAKNLEKEDKKSLVTLFTDQLPYIHSTNPDLVKFSDDIHREIGEYLEAAL